MPVIGWLLCYIYALLFGLYMSPTFSFPGRTPPAGRATALAALAAVPIVMGPKVKLLTMRFK